MNRSNVVNVHAHAEKKGKKRKEKALTIGWATKAQLHAVCLYDVHGWGNLSEFFWKTTVGEKERTGRLGPINKHTALFLMLGYRAFCCCCFLFRLLLVFEKEGDCCCVYFLSLLLFCVFFYIFFSSVSMVKNQAIC